MTVKMINISEPESATVAPMSEEVFEMDASECNTIKFLEHIQVSFGTNTMKLVTPCTDL